MLQCQSTARNQPPTLFLCIDKKYFVICSKTSQKLGKFEIIQFYIVGTRDKTWLYENL